MEKNLNIKKSSGRIEKFSREKLIRSLMNSGADFKSAEKIVKKLGPKLYPNISTQRIHRLAYALLKRDSNKIAADYRIDRAILELGPDGFLFEKFIARMLQAEGFETKTNLTLKGRCVSHEIDIEAIKNKKRSLIECKFHNNDTRTNDVKVALYVHARSLDLAANKDNDFDDFWLISNTKFTQDAIVYANCSGLRIIGKNTPPGSTVATMVARTKMYPISCLSSLKRNHRKMLNDRGVLAISDLRGEIPLMLQIGLTEKEISKILDEMTFLNL
jgi:Holliday junction resolvase-like predicted endonuclease